MVVKKNNHADASRLAEHLLDIHTIRDVDFRAPGKCDRM